MKKILVFAGTTEGRQLIDRIGDNALVDARVATSYGKEIIDSLDLSKSNVKVHDGRLTKDEMTSLMKEEGYDVVIDTTHPYADIVTANIKEAAASASLRYIRVLREEESSKLNEELMEQVIFVETIDDAIDYLNTNDEKVLLTVGSKELPKFTRVNNFKDRLFARVLPIGRILTEISHLGYEGRQIIAMQGPFSFDLNVAMINQLKAKIMVTKDGGKNGGFMDKAEAAKATGTKLLVVGRPTKEEGISVEEALNVLKEQLGVNILRTKNSPEATESQREESYQGEGFAREEKKDYFPFFADVKDKTFLVVGGGKIATRRINTLRKFNCKIRVVAPKFSDEIKEMNDVDLVNRVCYQEDLEGIDYLIAATNNEELNAVLAFEAKNRGIGVNVISNKEECTFFFPGVVVSGDVTVGVTAQGKDHKLAKEATRRIKGVFGSEGEE